MQTIDAEINDRLLAFARALIDQEKARVLVPPERPAPGYWFGGGNMAQAPDGVLWLCGRYRSAGDSRTGLDLGDRGRELAVFRSDDGGKTWRKALTFDKTALAPAGREVLSIEGSALRVGRDGAELFVSSEKRVDYPAAVADYLKPGTGVWTIERLAAPTVEGLARATVEPLLKSAEPERLHLKDPFLYDGPEGSAYLFFCHHPFNWSSSNSAFARLVGASVAAPDYSFLPRGTTWDVAIARATCLLDLPRLGVLADLPTLSLVFYDGGECLRSHEEHSAARRRPRGYSCEELGGLAYVIDRDFSSPRRLSTLFPAFVSPYGSGTSRYVDILGTEDGFFATWQQSQADRSQALVMNFLPMEAAARILG